MRLKEDKSSWNSSGVMRKDERNTKIEFKQMRHKSKKNKKRWCRGKPGVEHDKVWVKKVRYNHDFWTLLCKNCGREFDIWFDGKICGKPKPEGVLLAEREMRDKR